MFDKKPPITAEEDSMAGCTGSYRASCMAVFMRIFGRILRRLLESGNIIMKVWILLITITVLFPGKAFSQNSGQPISKPRLLVLTDMTSIKAGIREPDDAQSMIRLMLYANEFDIEGLIASSGLIHRHVVRPQYIRKIVNAYGKVRPRLILNAQGYPTANQLRHVIKSGQPNAGREVPVPQSIGKGKGTQASQWIIRTVDKPDKRPLWITIWGGSADLAQALWKVRKTRRHKKLEKFIRKIRVIASGDQDSTGPWIKSHFPNLFYVTRGKESRGMYRGGDTVLVSSAWVQKHVKGHGALGNLYPDYNGGDIWVKELGKVRGIKEGDSPDFLGLITNGLNVRDHLTWENWGGRKKQDVNNPHHYHDAIDPVGNYQTDISPYLAAVYRWRPAFQADFAARLDWCVKPYSQTNHAPVDSKGIGIVKKNVAAGKKVKLRGENWSDPDGNKLAFHWQELKEESTYPKKIKIRRRSGRSTRFRAPAVKHPRTIHILLTVTDDGHPALNSYKRFNYTVYPQ